MSSLAFILRQKHDTVDETDAAFKKTYASTSFYSK